jgi:uncharacterized protein HemX
MNNVNKARKLTNQSGFAVVIFVIIAVLIVGVGTAGFLLIKNREDADTTSELSSVVIEDENTSPNGSTLNAVNTVNAQLEAEINDELESGVQEALEGELNDESLREIEDIASEDAY